MQIYIALLMTLLPTMIITTAEGATILEAYPIASLLSDPYNLESSKVWERNNTNAHNSTPAPSCTSSYVPKHIANSMLDSPLSTIHHGQCECVDLAAICCKIELENKWFTKFIANLFPSL